MARIVLRVIPASLAVAVVAVAVTAAAEGQSVTTAKNKALAYFATQQIKSGGFGAPGQRPALTPWVVQALAAAGRSPLTFTRPAGKSPIVYLQALDIDRQARGGSGATRNPANVYAKLIITYRAAGVRPLIGKAGSRRINLVKRLLLYRNDRSGAFTTEPGGRGSYAAVSTTTWALLALRAAGRSPAQLADSVAWLRGQQAPDGGFSYTPGGASDTDSTAAAIQALRAAGVSSSTSTIRQALAYLHRQQRANGGFASGMGGTTTAESTAWAVQAIRAAGGNPQGRSWQKAGGTPIAFLLALQSPSGAFYHYGKTLATPLLTTSQAVVALSGKRYPF